MIFICLFWLLTQENQRKLPYKVNGVEILTIKEKCKDLAVKNEVNWNNSRIGTHQLVSSGYSEFGGYCYAEFVQTFTTVTSKLLYNTTEDKELFRREWPKDSSWYEFDFERIVLGRSRIIDFRGPW